MRWLAHPRSTAQRRRRCTSRRGNIRHGAGLRRGAADRSRRWWRRSTGVGRTMVPRGMPAVTERCRVVVRCGWKGGDALQLWWRHQLAGAAGSRRSGGVAKAERLDAR
ncbi:unnamed protein product [Urochloa humidicola]